MTARLIVGDVRAVLASLPDGSVDLVLTSPPFLALRSYLPAGHRDKALEIGSEATPGEFIDTLLDVVELLAPKLVPHGSICFELGDTYAGSGGAGGDYGEDGLRAGQERFDGSKSREYGTGAAARPARVGRDSGKHGSNEATRRERPGWPLDKSLCLIPELFRIALVYGFNPLTGRETPRWRARNVVRWCRPNPPVGALADKVRPATSDIVIVCAGRKRYFDLDAIRAEGPNPNTHARTAKGVERRENDLALSCSMARLERLPSGEVLQGAPPLDHWWFDDVYEQDAWLVSTAPYKGSHYATWPPDLLTRPILAMCPQRVCRVCGKPSERIAVTTNAVGEATGRRSWRAGTDGIGAGHSGPITNKVSSAPSAERETTGWTDCGHGDYRPGLVLDPFAGTFTTGAVANGHGRDAIGIDLDERNAVLAAERCGMFLTVERHDELLAGAEVTS